MIGLFVFNVVMLGLGAFMWNYDQEVRMIILLCAVYVLTMQSWAKQWIRQNESRLTQNERRLTIATVIFWVVLVAYIAGSVAFGEKGFWSFLSEAMLLILVVCAQVAYFRVCHNLYNATYSGFRAVRDAVAGTAFIRIIYSVASYAFGLLFIIQGQTFLVG